MKRILIAGEPGKFQNYMDALIGAGAQPTTAMTDINIEDFDGLLLPGGADIDPKYYHEENRRCLGIDNTLDEAQFAALDLFVKAGKPVLGICRGHQLINVYFGGSLIQEIPAFPRHVMVDKKDNVHMTEALAGSFVGKLYGTKFATNSSHHQAVGRLGKGMIPVQWSEHHTIIEASYHESLPVWSVQWHPERMSFAFRREDTVDGADIFHFFLEQ